ncbi:MAG: hypothetical protein KC502_14630 [Myxococcales bacterium]|nr:hypothetical protein [Myxococcales bacterium]
MDSLQSDTGQWRSRVGKELRQRIDALDVAPNGKPGPFPAAAAFLRGLEVLCRGGHGFHLGGKRHAHLYFGDAFLLYLRIEGLDRNNPSLLLAQQPHGKLKHGTLDASHLLFGRRIHGVIAALGLEHDQRLMRMRDGYRALPGVPSAFFQLIQAQLIDIVQAGEHAQMGQQPSLFAMPPPKPRRKQRDRSQGPPPPATVALAGDIDRHVATLTELLSARLGAKVTFTLADGELSAMWIEGEAERRESAWSWAELVARLAPSPAPE